jgi:hypothetical protein
VDHRQSDGGLCLFRDPHEIGIWARSMSLSLSSAVALMFRAFILMCGVSHIAMPFVMSWYSFPRRSFRWASIWPAPHPFSAAKGACVAVDRVELWRAGMTLEEIVTTSGAVALSARSVSAFLATSLEGRRARRKEVRDAALSEDQREQKRLISISEAGARLRSWGCRAIRDGRGGQ